MDSKTFFAGDKIKVLFGDKYYKAVVLAASKRCKDGFGPKFYASFSKQVVRDIKRFGAVHSGILVRYNTGEIEIIPYSDIAARVILFAKKEESTALPKKRARKSRFIKVGKDKVLKENNYTLEDGIQTYTGSEYEKLVRSLPRIKGAKNASRFRLLATRA